MVEGKAVMTFRQLLNPLKVIFFCTHPNPPATIFLTRKPHIENQSITPKNNPFQKGAAFSPN